MQPTLAALAAQLGARASRSSIRGSAVVDACIGGQESIVKEIATPRGWYRTYDKFVSGDSVHKELQSRCFPCASPAASSCRVCVLSCCLAGLWGGDAGGMAALPSVARRLVAPALTCVSSLGAPEEEDRRRSLARRRECVAANLQGAWCCSLGQSFDVVHCMSGGFLNLALVLSSGIPVRYKVGSLGPLPFPSGPSPQPGALARGPSVRQGHLRLRFCVRRALAKATGAVGCVERRRGL